MTPQEIDRLRYRRQYLLTPHQLECPFLNNHLSISQNLNLYTHVDLNVCTLISGNRKIVLLGDIFDYRYPDYKNPEIMADLINYSFDDLLSKISEYCGRFVIIWKENEKVILIHDAAASRKIFYHRNNDGVFCTSQPHLLARILKLELSSDKSKLDFYSSKEFIRLHNSNIGNTTCYDEVYQLMPNHFFDLNEYTPKRYWPNHKIEALPVKEVADKCSNIVRGYMKSIANRYSVMLPVTAGKDSRLLLSATFDIRNSLFYYINKGSHLDNKHQDIVIPGKLLPKLNLKFNIIDPCNQVDEDFEKIYFENNRLGSISYLPIIYNYYNKFSDFINLPGTCSGTTTEFFQSHGKPITAELLAKMIGVERFDYAIAYYARWLSECEPLCKENNLRLLNLFYLEERMPNWGTQIQIDKDIAQEEFMPYNSRQLIETMLMAPVRSREKPEYLLIHEIIRRLWPETLLEPFNSDLKRKALIISKKLGIMRPLKAVHYSIIPKLVHAIKGNR